MRDNNAFKIYFEGYLEIRAISKEPFLKYAVVGASTDFTEHKDDYDWNAYALRKRFFIIHLPQANALREGVVDIVICR